MPMNKSDRAALIEWVQLHRCCAVCWWPESDGRRKLDVHHLVGGAGRKHDARNYLRLCSNCHTVLHGGSRISGLIDLTPAILLSTKQECDPDNYDPAYLASLKRKKHLGYDPAPLPEFYKQQRELNVQGWQYRKP